MIRLRLVRIRRYYPKIPSALAGGQSKILSQRFLIIAQHHHRRTVFGHRGIRAELRIARDRLIHERFLPQKRDPFPDRMLRELSL